MTTTAYYNAKSKYEQLEQFIKLLSSNWINFSLEQRLELINHAVQNGVIPKPEITATGIPKIESERLQQHINHIQGRTPEFINAVQHYLNLVEQHGEESNITIDYFCTQLLPIMPQHLKNELHNKAEALGFIPQATAFSDDGEPLISLEDMASSLGLQPEEILQALEQMGHQPHTGNINRIQ